MKEEVFNLCLHDLKIAFTHHNIFTVNHGLNFLEDKINANNVGSRQHVKDSILHVRLKIVLTHVRYICHAL